MTQSRNKQLNSSAASSRARKIAIAGLLTALALIFSYIEVLIPFTPGIPGIKLGIANLVIIVALYYLNDRYAFAVNMLRVIIAGLLFTGVFGMLYSMAGALLSFFTMVLLKRTGRFSIIGVSMAGGVMHNLGQILIAAVVIGNIKIFGYFPLLIFSGIASGIIIGFIGHLILNRLPGYSSTT